MFTPIDQNNWPRKEIYEKFQGYTYSVTVEMDITHFLSRVPGIFIQPFATR